MIYPVSSQRFHYPKVEKKISTITASANGDMLTFTGCVPSKPVQHSHHSKHSHKPKKETRLLTNDGQDFDAYWQRQGLQDFQIGQLKKQALKGEPASYVKSDTGYSANFDLNLGRSKNDLVDERPCTPHEQSMLALQQEHLSQQPQTEVQAFLARIYLYCTHKLRPSNSGVMRAEITKFAVPLSARKEFYRGMLLSNNQLRLILAHSEGEEADRLRAYMGIPKPSYPYPQLAKHILHGFPVAGGKYTHHGITSISTLPDTAAKYANKAYQKLGLGSKAWDWSQNQGFYRLIDGKVFVPVVVTIVNDEQNRAKGVVLEKNYFKAKHEILLDSTNQYALAENPLTAKHGMLQLRILASHA